VEPKKRQLFSASEGNIASAWPAVDGRCWGVCVRLQASGLGGKAIGFIPSALRTVFSIA
jgi:hypothetical protein